jgi:hypothetical protein
MGATDVFLVADVFLATDVFFRHGLTRISTDETQWGEWVNGCFGSREAAKPRREGQEG